MSSIIGRSSGKFLRMSCRNAVSLRRYTTATSFRHFPTNNVTMARFARPPMRRFATDPKQVMDKSKQTLKDAKDSAKMAAEQAQLDLKKNVGKSSTTGPLVFGGILLAGIYAYYAGWIGHRKEHKMEKKVEKNVEKDMERKNMDQTEGKKRQAEQMEREKKKQMA